MQPIEGQTAEAFEVLDLERMLDDELRCQVIHEDRTVCTVEVTHRLRYCEGAGLMCVVAAEGNEKRMREGRVCSHCRRPARDCWDIRAI